MKSENSWAIAYGVAVGKRYAEDWKKEGIKTFLKGKKSVPTLAASYAETVLHTMWPFEHSPGREHKRLASDTAYNTAEIMLKQEQTRI